MNQSETVGRQMRDVDHLHAAGPVKRCRLFGSVAVNLSPNGKVPPVCLSSAGRAVYV